MSRPKRADAQDHNGRAPKPLAVTVKQGRAIVGLGNTKFYELIKSGRVQTTMVDGRRLVIYASLEKLLGVTG